MTTFQGFGPTTIRFLEDLEDHNDRDWFKANKHRYDAQVLEPAFDFITAMGPRLDSISECFTAIPKRTGGSLMRVYRDTRFSKDKTPYKTNIGIQFRHERGKDVHAPGYYLHIESTGCFLGAGIWHPEPGVQRAIRERIVSKPTEWQSVIWEKTFKDTFVLEGDSLKRPPRGFGDDTPHLVDVKRKDFVAVCDFSIGDAARPEFADQVAECFSKATPLMRFLCAAAEVEF